MSAAVITEQEFSRFRDLIHDLAGIHLSDGKKALVSGRLGRRLRHYGLNSYADYFRLVSSGQHPDERQTMVDLLTTNETYFFREPRHFEFLRDTVLPAHRGEPFSVWSAACSSGQEPYSLAMVLDDKLGSDGYRILGTDISSRVLETARQAVYPLAEARKVPNDYLRRYCLKGVRSQQGRFAVHGDLRANVAFRPINLNGEWQQSDRYHAIFLRNVMIYFNRDTKARLVDRLAERLRPGGYFIIGHSETLNGVSDRFRAVMPSVYRLK